MIRFYAVYDAKSETWDIPFRAGSDVEVVRMIDSEFKRNSETMYVMYPEDFSVWFVGEFDQGAGVYQPVNLVKVANFTDFVKKD